MSSCWETSDPHIVDISGACLDMTTPTLVEGKEDDLVLVETAWAAIDRLGVEPGAES